MQLLTNASIHFIEIMSILIKTWSKFTFQSRRSQDLLEIRNSSQEKLVVYNLFDNFNDVFLHKKQFKCLKFTVFKKLAKNVDNKIAPFTPQYTITSIASPSLYIYLCKRGVNSATRPWPGINSHLVQLLMMAELPKPV